MFGQCRRPQITVMGRAATNAGGKKKKKTRADKKPMKKYIAEKVLSEVHKKGKLCSGKHLTAGERLVGARNPIKDATEKMKDKQALLDDKLAAMARARAKREAAEAAEGAAAEKKSAVKERIKAAVKAAAK